MRKKLMRLVRLIPIALLVAAGVAAAQTGPTATGVITGVITDASTGKPVAGAVVIGTSPAAKGEQTGVTDASGKFTISNLPAGNYKLGVQLGGYKPGERADLVVKADTTLRANVTVVPEAVQMEEVLITGSRVKRKDLTSDSPVTVITSQVIMDSGQVTLGAFLATLPDQGGALNAQVNNGGDGSSQISLRGLGPQRTLVLVDGKRFPAFLGATTQTVDVNAIPTFAVERIEILKDGGSAIYGSDAITGVVNVITKKNMNGVNAQVYYGLSNYGDGNTFDVSATGGVQGEKGSAVFSAGYFNQQPVTAAGRPWASSIYTLDYLSGTTFVGGSSRIPAGRFRLNPFSCNTPACLNLQGKAPGAANWYALPPPAGGGVGGADNYARRFTNDDFYNFQPSNFLYTPSERVSVFANGNYKIDEDVKFFFQSSFQNRTSSRQLAPMPVATADSGVIYSKDSIYNPYGVDLFDVRKRMVEFGNRVYSDDINFLMATTGLEGTLPEWAGFFKGWFWNTFVNYGRSSGVVVTQGTLRTDKLQSAIGPSMRIGAVPICVLTPGDASTVIPGCAPLNMIGGVGSATGQEGNLAFTGTDYNHLQQVTYDINFSGTIGKLPWADVPVGLAVGYEYRNDGGAFIANPISAANESTDQNYVSTKGGYFTNEAYAELNIPIVTNMTGIEDLEVMGALRFVDYNTFGTHWSWKVGGRYKPIRDLALRGTYSTAFRAPNIAELFGGAAESFPSVSDPCAGPNIDPNSARGRQCRAEGPNVLNNGDDSSQLKENLGGNSQLQPETATTWTAGFVYEPGYLKGFALTADYYAIEVKNVIGALGAGFILNSCYPADPASTPKYCDLIQRNPNTGTVSLISDTQANLTSIKTAGVDVSVNYRLPSYSFGQFQFLFNLAWLQYFDLTQPNGTVLHGKNNYDLIGQIGATAAAGGLNPEWKFNTGVTWNLQGFGAGLSTRFIGSWKECATSDGLSSSAGQCSLDSTFSRKVAAYNVWDMFVGYTYKSSFGSTNFAFGMNNLFNTFPPAIYNNTTTGSDGTAYDYMGRFYYFRLGQSI